jgi:DNA-binding YbaB/EbfC family protein
MNDLLSQMQEVQRQLMDAQQTAADTIVEGSAGGGAVTVKISGGLEFLEVHIDPSVVDSEEVDMLEDLVLAAIRDGLSRANDVNRQALGPLGALGDLGGLGGGLGGLLGG